jgi:hypothetical protein
VLAQTVATEWLSSLSSWVHNMAEPKRYVVLDENGNFINVIVWDGITVWTHPEDQTLVLEESPEGQAAIAIHNKQNLEPDED